MPLKFLGLTCVNAQANLALNGGRGELRINAVQDIAYGDVPAIPAPGSPVYFNLGDFRFNGLLQNYKRATSVGGINTYSFDCVDPSEILESVPIVTEGYAGSSIVSNLVNVYAWWENLIGYGGSESNSSGMEWAKVRMAILTIVNGLGGSFGGPIKYRGVAYGLDLSDMPTPPRGYRVASNGRTLKELIGDVCADCATDFFCELNGTTIKIRAVNRSAQSPPGGLSAWLGGATLSGLVSNVSLGIELRNETTSVLLTGGYRSTVVVTESVASYWGDDIAGFPIIGVPGVHADLPTFERCDYFTVPCLEIADLLGAVTYATNTLEMRAALGGANSWMAYLAKYKPVTAALTNPIFVDGGPFAKMKMELLNEGQQAILRAVNEDIETQSHIFYLFVLKYAQEFYGKKFLAFMPDILPKIPSGDSIGPEFSDTPAESGYLPAGAASIGLGILDEGKFQDADRRVLPFVIIPGANAVDAGDLDPTSTAISGGQIYERSSVSNRIVMVGGVPAVIVTLGGAVFTREVLRGADSVLVGGPNTVVRNNGAGGNVPIYVHPEAKFPAFAGVPLLSNVNVYGPWSANGAAGKTEFIQDESLVPWQYGGEVGMNIAGIAKIAAKVSQQVTGETGDMTVAGIPMMSLGDAAVAGGPVATSIDINYGVGGFSTTYRFSTFTPRYQGAFHRQAIEAIKKNSRLSNEARRKTIKGIARGVLLGEARGKARAARAFRDGLAKWKAKESPHEAFIGKVILDGADVRVMASTGTQEELLALCNPDDDAAYKNVALMSSPGLFRPFRSSAPEPNGSAELLSSYQLISASTLGSGNANAITSDVLFPYAAGHDVEGLAWGATYAGYNARVRLPNPIGIRAMALKGPLVVQGYGQGIDGAKYPKGATPNTYLANYLRRSDKWPTAPVDHLYDPVRNVWTSHDNYRGTTSSNVPVSGTGLMYVGGNASWSIPIYNPTSSATVTGTNYTAYYVVNENRFLIMGQSAVASNTGARDYSLGFCLSTTSLSGYVTSVSLMETRGRANGSTYCRAVPVCRTGVC